MKKKLRKELDKMKKFFLDALLVYKNFFHWNKLKIFIGFYSILIPLLISIPILLLLGVFVYFSGLSPYLQGIAYLDIRDILSQKLLPILFVFFLGFLILFLFGFFYLYGRFLLLKVNFGYLESKKLKPKENNYFSIKKMMSFLVLLSVFFLSVLLPFIVFTLFNSLLSFLEPSFLYDGVFTIADRVFYIFSLLLYIAMLIGMSYIFYRLVFSFYYLSIDKKSEFKKSLQNSLNNTKGFKNYFRFLLVIFIFLLFTAPYNIVKNNIDYQKEDITNYIIYLGLNDESKTEILNSDNSSYISSLEIRYDGYSLLDSQRELVSINFKIFIIYILYFLLIYGLLESFLTAFFKNQIKK